MDIRTVQLSNLPRQFSRSLENISFDPAQMEARLRSRVTLAEFGAIALCIGLTLVFASIQDLPFDYGTFIRGATGDYTDYHFMHWLLPFFWLFAQLAVPVGYVLFNLLVIGGAWVAVRIFGGNTLLALTSYQMLYILFYGNMTGLNIGLLAVFWLALARKSWWLAGTAVFISAGKPQIGMVFGAYLWLLADISWKGRVKALIIPVLGVLFSLIIAPQWPSVMYETLTVTPPDSRGSIALWRWIGPWALALWGPVIYVLWKAGEGFSSGVRYALLISVTMLTLPYFQSADLLALFVLPVGWLPVLGLIGYGFIWWGYTALPFTAIIPGLTYVVLIWWGLWGIEEGETDMQPGPT